MGFVWRRVNSCSSTGFLARGLCSGSSGCITHASLGLWWRFLWVRTWVGLGGGECGADDGIWVWLSGGFMLRDDGRWVVRGGPRVVLYVAELGYMVFVSRSLLFSRYLGAGKLTCGT